VPPRSTRCRRSCPSESGNGLESAIVLKPPKSTEKRRAFRDVLGHDVSFQVPPTNAVRQRQWRLRRAVERSRRSACVIGAVLKLRPSICRSCRDRGIPWAAASPSISIPRPDGQQRGSFVRRTMVRAPQNGDHSPPHDPISKVSASCPLTFRRNGRRSKLRPLNLSWFNTSASHGCAACGFAPQGRALGGPHPETAAGARGHGEAQRTRRQRRQNASVVKLRRWFRLPLH